LPRASRGAESKGKPWVRGVCARRLLEGPVQENPQRRTRGTRAAAPDQRVTNRGDRVPGVGSGEFGCRKMPFRSQ
jgi:hypothetical protein